MTWNIEQTHLNEVMQQYNDNFKSDSKRFLCRFLKENRLYSKFQYYIHNKSTWNFYQKRCGGMVSIDQAVNDKEYCAHLIEYYIGLFSYLFTWRKTEEGEDFWHEKYNKLLKEWIDYILEKDKIKNGNDIVDSQI